MHKKILLLLLLLIPLASASYTDIGAWYYDGINAIAENQYAKVDIVPETATGLGTYTQKFTLTPKVNVTNVRAVYMFPEKPAGNIERLAAPKVEKKLLQTTYNMALFSYDYNWIGGPDNSYLATVYYDANRPAIEWQKEVKDTNIVAGHRVFYWDENVSTTVWKDISSKFHTAGLVDWNGQQVWYYYSDVFSLSAWNTETWKLNYQVNAPSGKWTLAFIKGSPTCLLDNSCAISWVIDPGWRSGNYDTFEDGDYTNDPTWEKVGAGGSMSVTEASKKNGTYGLEFDGYDATNAELRTSVNLATLDTWTWVRFSSTTSAYIVWQYQTSGTTVIAGMGINNTKFQYRDDGAYHDMVTSPSVDTWYIFRMEYTAGDKVNFYLHDASFALLESVLDKTPNSTDNVGYVNFFIQNTPATVYYDDVGYGDTTGPTGPPPPPDVNVVGIGGYTFEVALPEFSYNRDGNISIDFNAIDYEGKTVTIDINYSAEATQGTGTVIADDKNSLAICTGGVCSWDLNIHGVTDHNYFINIYIEDVLGYSDFNSSAKTFGIDNTGPTDTSHKPVSDKTNYGNTVFFTWETTDANTTVKSCGYGIYVNGGLDSNGFVDLNAAGFCHVDYARLDNNGDIAYVIFNVTTDLGDNNTETAVKTSSYTRLDLQEVVSTDITDEDFIGAYRFFGFKVFTGLASLAFLLVMLCLLGLAIYVILSKTS